MVVSLNFIKNDSFLLQTLPGAAGAIAFLHSLSCKIDGQYFSLMQWPLQSSYSKPGLHTHIFFNGAVHVIFLILLTRQQDGLKHALDFAATKSPLHIFPAETHVVTVDGKEKEG